VHELSLCQSIGQIVRRHAADRRVEVVHLQVGQLRQVVPDSLIYCWGLVNEGTVCEGSVLDIDHVPAAVRCTECGGITDLAELRMECGTCGSRSVSVERGEEFLVTSIELAEV
jgi:hydrogenase nickel incorporation protein HypA/HybF